MIGQALFLARGFDEAVPKLILAIQDDPTFPAPYRYLAACYAHMGRLAEAQEILQRLRAIGGVADAAPEISKGSAAELAILTVGRIVIEDGRVVIASLLAHGQPSVY